MIVYDFIWLKCLNLKPICEFGDLHILISAEQTKKTTEEASGKKKRRKKTRRRRTKNKVKSEFEGEVAVDVAG